jgi:hypothetical protein
MSGTNADSSYRWYVLGLAALTHALAVAAPMMCMPVLFDEISRELGLSLVEIGAIWGLSSLAGVLSGVMAVRWAIASGRDALCVYCVCWRGRPEHCGDSRAALSPWQSACFCSAS